MAKVNIKKPIIDKINNSLLSDEFAKDVGEHIIRNVKGSVRKAQKPDGSGKYDELKSVKHRKYLEKYGNATGASYGTSKPNLTISGQLLESLKSFYDRKLRRISIMAMGVRKKYKGRKGAIGNLIRNEDLAKWQKDLGRNIFLISKKMRDVVANKVRAHLRRKLK